MVIQMSLRNRDKLNRVRTQVLRLQPAREVRWEQAVGHGSGSIAKEAQEPRGEERGQGTRGPAVAMALGIE